MGAEEGIPPGPEVSPDSVQLLGGFLPWIGSEAGIFAQLALIAKHRLASVSFPIAWNADFWEILPVISVLRPRNGRLGCVIFRIQQSCAFRPRFGCWCDKEDRRVNFTVRRILAGLLAMSLIAPASVGAQQPQMSMPRQPLGEETGVQANSELPLPGQPMPSPPKAQGQPASAPGSNARAQTQPPAAGGQLPAAAEAVPPGQATGRPTTQAAADNATQPKPDGDDNGAWSSGVFGPGCTAATCCEICGGGSGPPPDYYVEGGPIILARNRPTHVMPVSFERTSGTYGLPPQPSSLRRGSPSGLWTRGFLRA